MSSILDIDPRSLRDRDRVAPGLSSGVRASEPGRCAVAVRARLAGVEADLLAGDRAAGRRRLRGDRARSPWIRRQRASARTASTTSRPTRSTCHALVHDEFGHESVVRAGWRSRRTRHPGPRPAPPGLGRSDGAVQLATAVPQGRDGGHHGTRPPPSRPTTSCARAPMPTGSLPSWPPPISAVVTSPRSTRAGSGPIRARSRRAACVDFHTEPFGDAAQLRASFGGVREHVRPGGAVGPSMIGPQRTHADADPVRHERPRDLSGVRPDGGQGLPRPRRSVPAPRLRPLRAVGGPARPGQRHGRVLRRPAGCGR